MTSFGNIDVRYGVPDGLVDIERYGYNLCQCSKFHSWTR